MKPFYVMSSVGECSRVLAAVRLGYEPTPMPRQDEERLKHYSRCEALAAQQLMDLGYRLQVGDFCPKCKRNGIHVEVDTPLFLLVGHLDRRLILDGKDSRKLPVEIKSLGKTSWTKFSNQKFAGFPGYTGQEVCYLEAEKQPGVYWVMERDSGQPLKYIVNDFNNEINLDGFEKITLPVTFDQIVDKLNLVEIAVQDKTLPDGEDSDACFWCRFKYLCVKSEPEEKSLKIETRPDLIEAALMYKDGLNQEKSGKELKEAGKDILLGHAKQTGIDKFKVTNISLAYNGQRVKETLDKKLIKTSLQDLVKQYGIPTNVPDEIIRVSTKVSDPYDDYTIKVLKE